MKPGSFFMIWPWYTHVSSLGGYMVFNFINTQVMKTSQALWLPHISDNSSWHFNKILLWLCSWNVGFSAKESIPVFHRWYNTDKLWLHKSFQFENPCRNLLPCIFEFFLNKPSWSSPSTTSIGVTFMTIKQWEQFQVQNIIVRFQAETYLTFLSCVSHETAIHTFM